MDSLLHNSPAGVSAVALVRSGVDSGSTHQDEVADMMKDNSQWKQNVTDVEVCC